jgi:hypothetical protein
LRAALHRISLLSRGWWLLGASLSRLAAWSFSIKRDNVAVCLKGFKKANFQSDISMPNPLLNNVPPAGGDWENAADSTRTGCVRQGNRQGEAPARFDTSHCIPLFELSLRMLSPCSRSSIWHQGSDSFLVPLMDQARVGRRALVTGLLKPNPREGQGMPVDLIVHEIDYLADPVSKPISR